MGIAAIWGILIICGSAYALRCLHQDIGHCLFCLGDDVDDEHRWNCKWCEKGKMAQNDTRKK